MTTTSIAKVGGGATALLGTCVGGTYAFSKENVWSQEEIKSVCVASDSEDKTIWLAVQNKLKNGDPQTKEFKDLKEELSKEITNDTGERTKNKCVEIYESTYKSIFGSYEKGNQLIEEVKKFCSLTVQERIGSEKLVSKDFGEAVWKKVHKKVKEANVDDKLDEVFKTLKTEISSDSNDTKWETTKTKCLDLYSKNNNTISPKLKENIEKYCSYTIGEHLKSQNNTKIFEGTGEESTDKTEIETKITSLNDNSSEPFKKFKPSNTSAEKDWKGYRAECQKLYKKQWNGDTNQNDYSLANSNCTKTGG